MLANETENIISILSTLETLIFVGVIVLVVLLIRKKKRDSTPYGIEAQGQEGEALVSKRLNQIFGKNNRLINNLTLIDEKTGMSHQIDHVEICSKGIFCIETKNYSGKVYGEENSEQWMEYQRGKKVTFYNPIKQNMTHVYFLTQTFDLPCPVQSLVIFVKNNAGKVLADNVINLADLEYYLYHYNSSYNLSDQQMDDIYTQLTAYKDSHNISTADHVRNIHIMADKIDNNICPRCGGKLILKHGKYGDFYGCENYPKCKFIKKLDDRDIDNDD